MKIKSLSDVITNSSHEVFIFRDIKDPGELKRYIKSKTDVMSEPWLFKEEDIQDVDISWYHETPDTPESRFEALRDLLEKDKIKYGECTRFEVRYKDYHKLYKKFLKSKLPASIFLGKYTDQEIKHYLEVGDPWDAHHLIGCWISDWFEDYVDHEILEDLEKKYKNSEYIMKNFINWGLKVRKDESRNYYSVWENLKTTRLDLGEEVKLPYGESEFYDIGVTERCNAMCDFCFTPGMKVMTNSGEKNIEDISIGDEIISFNIQNNSKEVHQVDQKFERDYIGELVSIELENGKIIKMTPNHKVFVINKGWINAKNLKETDELYDIK